MGLSLESTSMQMLNVGYVRHCGDWNWKNVCSPFTRIYYVTEGEAEIHMEEQHVHLRPDHLYVVPANVEHSYECRGVFCHYYLHMFEMHNSGSYFLDFYDFPFEVEATPLDRAIFAEMCQRHPEAKLPASDPRSYDNNVTLTNYVERCNRMTIGEKVLLECFIGVLFSRFLQKAEAHPWTKDTRLIRAHKYINSHLDKDIDIDSLANMACVTKPYLIRIFKQSFGISPLQFINKKKIERAQLLLITEDKTIKEIAYMLGFNDHSYFNRLFKKMCGHTPQDYREKARVQRLKEPDHEISHI